MFTIKNLVSRYYFHLCLKPYRNPSSYFTNPKHTNSASTLKSWLISLPTRRNISVSTNLEPLTTSKSQKTSKNRNLKHKNKKPLDILFKEALGSCERNDIIEGENEEDLDEDGELRKKLRDLEIELRQLKLESENRGNGDSKLDENKHVELNSKPKSLSNMFEDVGGDREILFKKGEEGVLKDITEDMQMLLRHLYDKGYFKDVNFMPGNGFDAGYFDTPYARDFIKFAVERFGEDHQEVAKWLSGSDMKALAMFGCPSLIKREIFAAKRLRIFFEIPEESVCSKCCLKESCKFVNQSVWGGDNKKLRLDLLMRLLKTYSLEDVPPQLKLTDDLKACVGRLMHEVINLTKNA